MQINKSGNGATVPESLYRQTSLMIQHGILDLDAIYEMLGPEDSVIRETAEKEMAESREFIRKMNIVSTKDKEENGDKPQDIPEEDDKKVRSHNWSGELNIFSFFSNFTVPSFNDIILIVNLNFVTVCIEPKIWFAGSIATSWSLEACSINHRTAANSLRSITSYDSKRIRKLDTYYNATGAQEVCIKGKK